MNFRERDGFYLNECVGNNSFSFKKGKKVWVSGVKIGILEDIKLGNKIVFADIDDGIYKESVGLCNCIWVLNSEKYYLKCPVFVCDNHNLVIEAWEYFKDKKPFLIHIDQHKDEADYGIVNDGIKDLRVCDYIKWAKDNGLIQREHLSLCESKDFNLLFNNGIEGKYNGNLILNIDLDIFASEQTIIPYETIWKTIKLFSKNALLITIATSPVFLDQEYAIKLIRDFFESSLKKDYE